MKTVVITGSARGFGLAMAKVFRSYDFNVVISDIADDALKEAYDSLNSLSSKGEVLAINADVTITTSLEKLIASVLEKFQTIDIWINNAGVNQPNKALWQLTEKEINTLLDIDLKGTILASRLIVPVMIKQGFGAIYNVEGHGSNDAKILGLSLYGTSKRAVTYFTEALAFEVDKLAPSLIVGKLTPGIMITNFIFNALGDGEKITLDEKTKNVYNILGERPEVIAKFMVDKIVNNKKNNVKFIYLTNARAMARFLKAPFKKHDFFK